MEYLNEQDLWEKVVGKAFADYGSLTREERVWFNIRGLINAFNSLEDALEAKLEPIIAKIMRENAWSPI